MTYQIQLNKLAQKDFELFKIVLHHYAQSLQFLYETMDKRKYAKDLSICVELWHEFNRKTTVRHPAQQATLKLSLHKAYVLLDAFYEYQVDSHNDYEKSRCNSFYMAIDQQLPTHTQLAINSNQ